MILGGSLRPQHRSRNERKAKGLPVQQNAGLDEENMKPRECPAYLIVLRRMEDEAHDFAGKQVAVFQQSRVQQRV
jgi:hypothetical protein